MIWESRFWKEDLLKIAERMKCRATQKRWTERSFANVEKDVFIAFYAIRKLMDAKKLSVDVTEKKVKLNYYPSQAETYRTNRHRIDENFDLDVKKTEEVDLLFLCNQIVHSYVFSPFIEESTHGLAGILFCSDRERNRKLYSLDLQDLIQILNEAGKDYPSGHYNYYDETISDFRVIAHNFDFNGLLEYLKKNDVP